MRELILGGGLWTDITPATAAFRLVTSDPVQPKLLFDRYAGHGWAAFAAVGLAAEMPLAEFEHAMNEIYRICLGGLPPSGIPLLMEFFLGPLGSEMFADIQPVTEWLQAHVLDDDTGKGDIYGLEDVFGGERYSADVFLETVSRFFPGDIGDLAHPIRIGVYGGPAAPGELSPAPLPRWRESGSIASALLETCSTPGTFDERDGQDEGAESLISSITVMDPPCFLADDKPNMVVIETEARYSKTEFRPWLPVGDEARGIYTPDFSVRLRNWTALPDVGEVLAAQRMGASALQRRMYPAVPWFRINLPRDINDPNGWAHVPLVAAELAPAWTKLIATFSRPRR